VKTGQEVAKQNFSFEASHRFYHRVPGGIRTPNLLIRSQKLYPVELQARVRDETTRNQISPVQKVAETCGVGGAFPQWIFRTQIGTETVAGRCGDQRRPCQQFRGHYTAAAPSH
jgi:hypothetical protein